MSSKILDFSKWLCRASQSSKLMTGTLGITSNQEATLQKLEDKIASGKPLTPLQEIEYNKLLCSKADRSLPKTAQSYLRAEHREMKYDRIFLFTNKYTQKGILQEDESITLLSNHLGVPLFKNEERRENKFFTGLPDLTPKIIKHGIDVKSSWELGTFPYDGDPLDPVYESQNQVYMNLWDCDRWDTVYCLVNATDQMVYNEKQKFYYALGQPDLEDPIYIGICKEIEKKMIFDKKRFDDAYPMFNWDTEDWTYDIPEEDRVVSFTSIRNDEYVKEMEERVVVGREYLKSLK